MNRQKWLAAALCGLAIFAFAGSVAADGYLKQVTHTNAFEMMGQKVPAKDDTTVMWIGTDRAATVVGDTSTIVVIPTEDAVLMINHTAKKFAKMPVNMSEMLDQAMAAEGMENAEEAAAAKEMMKAMMGQSKATVEETAETKKIECWQAKKYNVTFSMAMMTLKMEIWATEEIAIDYSLYKDLSGRMLSQMQGAEQLVEEMKKIKGVAVLTTTTVEMMGTPVTSESKLIEYADKAAPAGVYAVPAGYTEVPFGELQK
jgi:hypothetical protein